MSLSCKMEAEFAAAKLARETLSRPHQGNIMNQHESQQSHFSNNVGSLEDLVSLMMRQEQDEMKLLDGDLICDNYSSDISM